MKKLLLTSTALVTLVAGSAFADDLQVGAGGSALFEAGVRSQKTAYQTPHATPNQKNTAFNSKAKLYVKAMNKADNGLVYGAVAGVRTSAVNDLGYNSSQTDRTYLFLEGGFGRVELGSNYSAGQVMKVDAGSVARASGGATEGNWSDYVNTNGTGTNAYDSLYYMNSALLSENALRNSGANEEARKISYFTPRVSGFQVAVSYTPDSSNHGDVSAKSSMNSASMPIRDFKDVVSGGVNFTNQYDQFTLSLSAIGETGKGINVAGKDVSGMKHKLQSYSLGGSVSYANLALAASYGTTNKKSVVYDLTTPAVNNRGVKYWTAGASYVQGPMGASLTYLHSDAQRNKLRNVSVGVDFAAAQGLKLYAEDSMFQLKSSTASVLKNKGNVFLVGSKLNF